MADIKPFRCCRPRRDSAAETAALPYDVFTRTEAAGEIAKHPLSFLRIDKSCALLPIEIGEYDPRVYAKAAEEFETDVSQKLFVCEEREHYFLYRLDKEGHAQTGIVACIAVADYESSVLKCHENTRELKLEDRVRHIDALQAQTGPVFVAYRAQETIDSVVDETMATTEPLYDFISPDGVHHSVWRVDDSRVEAVIQNGFSTLDALYIADGHHRAAAAARIGAERGGEAAHFLIIAFPADQLRILDYNRVVFDRNGLSIDELFNRIGENFTIGALGNEPSAPSQKGEFSLYLDGTWYRLVIDEALRENDPVKGLDVSLLQDYLLAPILGIDDPRLSTRIAYVGGVRGLRELQQRADRVSDHGPGLALALYPCTLDELFAVADAGQLMPPKSTWFEPKPRSGLFIHKI